MGRPPEMSESEGERREKRARRGQYKRTTFTQRGKQKQMQHANIQFHTILVRTPLSRARGIQRRYSPQEGTVHTQVSHNRLTQHSTDSNTRPLSASHCQECHVILCLQTRRLHRSVVCYSLPLAFAGCASPVVCCISIS